MRIASTRLTLAVTALVGLFALSAPVDAGTGKVRTSGGKKLLDFCVSVRFTATPAQIDEIKRGFTDGSAVFLDASDNQFEFGRVAIVNSSGASKQAEVWIHEAAGGAVATYGKYGTSGEHINMYFPSNFSKSPAVDGDAYTVAHEMAHHLWGVADEYKGPSGAAECEPAPGSATANFCLMDNYFTRGGNMGTGTTYTLNEFCVASNHDPDKDTVQESFYMESCWEHIASHPTRPATAPAALPTDAAPSATAPTFREPGAQRRFVEVIDRSGSMSIRDGGSGTPTRLELAQQGANIFIDLTKVDDEIGVASFSSSASTNFPLTKIVGAATQTAAKAAVNSLSAGGLTAIGSGLIRGRDMITGAATDSCAQTIILFTDGFGNTGPGELTVIPSLVANDIAVISIAIGQSVSTANLSKIAVDTGGKFFQVQTAADLPALLASLAAESTGGGILARQPGFVLAGATETRTALGDVATDELTVVLTSSPGDDLRLSLISPSGTVIDDGFAAGSPDVDFISNPGTRILLVRRPVYEAGVWTLSVEGITVVDGNFVLTSSSDASEVFLAVSTDDTTYEFPRPILVQATPSFNLPVVDARVTATVVRPDGSTESIELFDDGDAAFGDVVPDDGTYTALFASFSESGSYRFDVVAESLPGSRTYGGEELFADAGAPLTELPVPPFRRETSVTAIVNNVPLNQPPTADAGPDQIVECATDGGSTVTVDGSASFDPDGDALDCLWTSSTCTFAEPTSCITTATCPLGDNTVTLVVNDGIINSSPDDAVITVEDTTAPEAVVTTDPASLWPPNHKMTAVSTTVVATDACDPSPTVVLESAVSSEPDDAQGGGDGNTTNDIQEADLGTHDLEVLLRAERQGRGPGRLYTLTYRATDASGNSATATGEVVVPHNQ